MLSVIVTGRNDAHGYNLHKRIALSLNCLAVALGHDDEIIFVDWNSPDEMPTVIEAIADTLTDTSREHLRVLRVRPAQHRRVCGVSHLPLIDPVARNVAIRRVRPESRWILSTSTDVILVPRRAGRTLCDIVPALEPALYQVPRFDVPESLWEALDRRDPMGAIAACEEWAAALHLNEIVEADPVVKYDGPGDFQLIPLAAAQQLCGFDERMVLTYHTDSNLAKRAGFLLGPVRTLVEELFLYHCNHYRQISVHHGPVRAENSWRRFFEEVDGPVLPSQADCWGLVDENIEEISLGRIGKPRMAAALAGVLPPAAEPFWTVANRADTYNQLCYRVAHVLPFVADLLQPMPRSAELAVWAADDALLGGLAAAWEALGFPRPILVADPRLQLGSPSIKIAAEAEILDRATAFLFDFGVRGKADPFADATSLARLSAVADSFRRAVARERERAVLGQVRRRHFIVVNAINTVFEKLVTINLTFTYTPFSGRVRHGTVALPRDPLATDIASLASWLAPRLLRTAAVPYQEIVDALELISEGFAANQPAPAAATVLALLDHPRLGEALSAAPERWRDWISATRAARPSQRLGASLCVNLRVPALGKPPTPNRLASIEDWEWPNWAEHLACNEETAATANALWRHRATWEIGQLLYAVASASPAHPIDRARVVLRHRNVLPIYLSRAIRHVEIIPGDRVIRLDEVWPIPDLPYDPGRVHAFEPAPSARGNCGPVDLIVLPGNAILGRGLAGFGEVLAELDRSLKMGGILAFAAEVVIAGGDADDRLPGGFLAGGELGCLVAQHTGFIQVGASDWNLSPATLDRLAVAGTASERRPHFVVQIGSLLSTTAVLVWRKQRATSEAEWARFDQAFTARCALTPRSVVA